MAGVPGFGGSVVPSSATPQPGYIPRSSTLPPGTQGIDSPAWVQMIIAELKQGIKSAYRNGQSIGMPASWGYGAVTTRDIDADGNAGPSLNAMITEWANSQQAAQDTDMIAHFGLMARPGSRPDDYVADPSMVANVLRERAAEAAQSQRLIDASRASAGISGGGGGSTIRFSSGGSSSGGSSGGFGGTGEDAELMERARQFNEQLQYQRLRDQVEDERYQQQFGYQQGQDTLAEAYRQQQLRQQRGQTIANVALSGDPLAREYALRGQAEPRGAAVDVFSGVPSPGQMTWTELATRDAPLLAPFSQPGLQGQPLPQAAAGGYTREPVFIAGDAPSGDMSQGFPEIVENPTGAPIKVRSSQESRGLAGVRRYAEGTPLTSTQIGSQDWGNYHNASAQENWERYRPPEPERLGAGQALRDAYGNQVPNSLEGGGLLVGGRPGGNQFDYYDPASRSYTPHVFGNWANPNHGPVALWNSSSAYSDGHDPQQPGGGVTPSGVPWLAPPVPSGIGHQFGPDMPPVDPREEAGGFRRVNSAGRISGGPNAPNAYVDLQPGDYLGRDDPETGAPTVLRWVPEINDYLAVPFAGVTEITGQDEWNALPWETRQAIIDERRFDYMVNDMGRGVAPDRQGIDRIQSPGWFGAETGVMRPYGAINSSRSVRSPFGLRPMVGSQEFQRPAPSPLPDTGLFRMPRRQMGGGEQPSAGAGIQGGSRPVNPEAILTGGLRSLRPF